MSMFSRLSHFTGALSTGILLLSSCLNAGEPLPLTQDGKTEYVVVTSPTATEAEVYAVKEKQA